MPCGSVFNGDNFHQSQGRFVWIDRDCLIACFCDTKHSQQPPSCSQQIIRCGASGETWKYRIQLLYSTHSSLEFRHSKSPHLEKLAHVVRKRRQGESRELDESAQEHESQQHRVPGLEVRVRDAHEGLSLAQDARKSVVPGNSSRQSTQTHRERKHTVGTARHVSEKSCERISERQWPPFVQNHRRGLGVQQSSRTTGAAAKSSLASGTPRVSVAILHRLHVCFITRSAHVPTLGNYRFARVACGCDARYAGYLSRR